MKDKPYFAAFGSEIRFIKGLCKKPLACYFADESGKSLFEQPDKILNEGYVKSCFCQQMGCISNCRIEKIVIHRTALILPH